jgi:hypothetical protein
MVEIASRQQLKRRRDELRASLPALSQNRADTYRLNSDALAVGRTRETYQDPREKARLSAAEVTADDAMRSVQREIRQLDQQIAGTSAAEFRSSVGRGLHPERASR